MTEQKDAGNYYLNLGLNWLMGICYSYLLVYKKNIHKIWKMRIKLKISLNF